MFLINLSLSLTVGLKRIGPAGCRINRDYARRGWATETGHPNMGPGPRDPGVRACRQALQTIVRETTRAEGGAACKGLEDGGDGVRTGAGAVKRGGEVGNGRVRVCQVSVGVAQGVSLHLLV